MGNRKSPLRLHKQQIVSRCHVLARAQSLKLARFALTVVPKVSNATPQQYDDLGKETKREWGGRMNCCTDRDAVLGARQYLHHLHHLCMQDHRTVSIFDLYCQE